MDDRVTHPDRGLLAIVRELERDLDAPPTTAAVAEAACIPGEYRRFIEERLERNAERGLVERDGSDHWQITAAGVVAASA
jgi:hypothetical protein